MKSVQWIGFIGLVLLFANFTAKKNSQLGQAIENFSLKDTKGKMVSFNQYPNAKGFIVLFTCNHCPFAQLYSKRINDLNTKYSKLGVPLLAINSMDTLMYEEESFELMQEKAKTEHFNFPYLYDADQVVGKMFAASFTPQTFVVWKENKQWVIKYMGAIDDNGEHPNKAHSFVGKAVDELLNNQPVSNPENKSMGCKIYYRK